ncbi:hypothetical protein C8J34_103297 [Rhizobium sp. PP-F2F-G36]|nr:hypothetical protein C8J34_103297 [Rhizobium sp. PP-F2F-G36]
MLFRSVSHGGMRPPAPPCDNLLTRLPRGPGALSSNAGGVISVMDVDALIARYDLASVRDLMLLLLALNRKNALVAGHDAGAENWATIALLTSKRTAS